MFLRIEELRAKKIVGNSIEISLSENRTPLVWKSFMPRRKEIPNRVSDDLISMSIYDPKYFDEFNPSRKFSKWAAVEVTDHENVPDGMAAFIIPAGTYAVFLHRGIDAAATFRYIFTEWLPASGYAVDDRPHFEVLGAKYKNNDPDSEEEVFIPVSIR